MKESIAQGQAPPNIKDIDEILDNNDEDKVYAAMGVAKTIATVSLQLQI